VRDRGGQPLAPASIFDPESCKSVTALRPPSPCKSVTANTGHAIDSGCPARPKKQSRSPIAIKPPERCPSCDSRRVAPKGSRAKKLETIRLYRCGSCRRTFTPGPRALRNKTYPLHEILDALSTYNRGFSLDETSRRLSSRRGHTVNPATISRWLAVHPRFMTYRRLRERQINQINVNRQSRQVAYKQVDGRAALEGKAGFFGYDR